MSSWTPGTSELIVLYMPGLGERLSGFGFDLTSRMLPMAIGDFRKPL